MINSKTLHHRTQFLVLVFFFCWSLSGCKTVKVEKVETKTVTKTIPKYEQLFPPEKGTRIGIIPVIKDHQKEDVNLKEFTDRLKKLTNSNSHKYVIVNWNTITRNIVRDTATGLVKLSPSAISKLESGTGVDWVLGVYQDDAFHLIIIHSKNHHKTKREYMTIDQAIQSLGKKDRIQKQVTYTKEVPEQRINTEIITAVPVSFFTFLGEFLDNVTVRHYRR